MNKKTSNLEEGETAGLRQTFLEHADELRARLLEIFFACAASVCVTFFFAETLIDFILRPVGRLIFTSPADAFMARVTLSMFAGIIFVSPLIFFQAWRFVANALHEHERKIFLVFIPASIVLFFLGGAFAYAVALPIAMEFLLGFASPVLIPMISVNNYLTFVGTMFLAFGAVFELPLIMMFLTKIGIATPHFLIQKRKYAIVGILILSAFLTPPDIITQLILSVPLVLLYEAGVLVSKWVYRGDPLAEKISEY